MKAAGVFIAGTVGGIAQMIWTAGVLVAGMYIGFKMSDSEREYKKKHEGKCMNNPEGECKCQK